MQNSFNESLLSYIDKDSLEDSFDFDDDEGILFK